MSDALKSLIVLVVEDEALISLDIEAILESESALVTTADSVGKAREAIATLRPELVILDALLPDGDSFTLAHELLAEGVSLIFVTGYAGGIPENLQRVPIVEKPFDREQLTAAVMRALGHTGEPAPT